MLTGEKLCRRLRPGFCETPEPQRSRDPWMYSSTHWDASPSGILTGGYLKLYDEILVSAPPIPRSRAIFVARMTSATTPALLGESSTESFRSIWRGTFPHFLPLR